MKNILIVFIGGGIGSGLRYICSYSIKSATFPAATFIVNIIGSFAIGALFALSIKGSIANPHWKLFLTSGICGGFTTLSAFSFENVQLIQEGKWMTFALYTIGTIFLGIIAALLGYKIIH
ncbi:MAG: fluoride efflux transporter CrcB [Ferruginibacter sp.]|nr:fluoride efflux transporter CrcB [Ferruginibacter sp.]